MLDEINQMSKEDIEKFFAEYFKENKVRRLFSLEHKD